MELLSERGGNVRIRFGGTTQDFTTMVPSVPDGNDTDIEKDVMQLQPESSVRFGLICYRDLGRSVYWVIEIDTNYGPLHYSGTYLYAVEYLVSG